MLGWLTKKVLSAVISLMVLYVPQEKYQRELDSLPTVAERVAGTDLQGWVVRSVVSKDSDITHYFYEYPPQSDSLAVLLCLHGFNTDGRVFTNLDTLADTYRLIAYNFPEKTTKYTGNMDDFVFVVEDFCGLLGIDTLVLVGNSVGGAVAMHLAAHATRFHVRQLVLLSTNVFGASPDDTREIRGMADKLLPYPDYKLYYLLTRGKAIVGRFRKTDIGEGAPQEALAIKHVAWYRQALQSLYDYDGPAAAARVRCPVLALHGEADRLIPVERARSTGELIAQATFQVVDGAGHTLVYTHGPLVAERIRQAFAPADTAVVHDN